MVHDNPAGRRERKELALRAGVGVASMLEGEASREGLPDEVRLPNAPPPEHGDELRPSASRADAKSFLSLLRATSICPSTSQFPQHWSISMIKQLKLRPNAKSTQIWQIKRFRHEVRAGMNFAGSLRRRRSSRAPGVERSRGKKVANGARCLASVQTRLLVRARRHAHSSCGVLTSSAGALTRA